MSIDHLGTTWAPDLGVRGTQLPTGLAVGMAANEDPVMHDIIGLNASGYGIVVDETDIDVRIVGVYQEAKSVVSTVNGANRIRVFNGYGFGMPMSASVPFVANDRVVPAYVTGRRQLGKNPSAAGVALPLAGLALGLDSDGQVIAWIGDVAQAVARGIELAGSALGGWYAHPVDGAASTTTAEKTIFRAPIPGLVTAINFDTLGTIAADATDYATITVYKADGAGGTHVSIGTYGSNPAANGAVAAGVPAVFTLSVVAGALNLLGTDILSYEVAKGGAGKIVPVGTLRVVQKVI